MNPHPELLFLDIQLTDGNSFMLIEQARPDSMIVFTTAYDEYAVRAFAVNSIDYLLKPIHQERLLQTIERFESLTEKYIRDFNRESRILAVSYTHLDVYKRQLLKSKFESMKFVKYFLQKRSVTILLLLLVLGGGLLSYVKMGKLEDAPFTIKQALVLTPYPGASPSEVQSQVTCLLYTSRCV